MRFMVSYGTNWSLRTSERTMNITMEYFLFSFCSWKHTEGVIFSNSKVPYTIIEVSIPCSFCSFCKHIFSLLLLNLDSPFLTHCLYLFSQFIFSSLYHFFYYFWLNLSENECCLFFHFHTPCSLFWLIMFYIYFLYNMFTLSF